jgi:F0F1-type ATP synthase assembly protein I
MEDKDSKKAAMHFVYASSFGIAMVIAVFGGILIGNWLDRKLGTGYKFAFLFLIIGIIAGFWNLYKWVRQTFKDDDEIVIMKHVKDEPHRKRPPVKKA